MTCRVNVRTTGLFPVYDSASAAIEGAKTQNLPRQDELATIRKQVIVAYAALHDRLLLSLGNAKEVVIRCSRRGVAWSVRPATTLRLGRRCIVPNEITLHYEGSGHEVKWNRLELLKRLEGRRLKDLETSSSLLFLYAEECPVVCFTRLMDIAKKKYMLHWDVDV